MPRPPSAIAPPSAAEMPRPPRRRPDGTTSCRLQRLELPSGCSAGCWPDDSTATTHAYGEVTDDRR